MKKITIFISFLLIVVSAQGAQADTYHINPRISEANFLLEHVVGFSSGFIREFSGTLDIDKKKNVLKKIQLELDMNTVDTFNETRDTLLKSEDFFDTLNHPKVVLKSKKITNDTITFEVLAKGIKKSINVDYKFFGFFNEPTLSKQKAVVRFMGTVKRTELGVTHNVQNEAGQNLLGDDLQLIFEIGAIE